MDALLKLLEIVATELSLELESVAELARAAGGSADESPRVEAIWDVLAAAKPEAFVGPSDPCSSSSIGLAYRYARRRTPHLLTAVDLGGDERRLLRTTRGRVADWSGLARWRGFRHVVFDPTCVALAATVAVRGSYGGGFALTWHPGLSRIALYPATRIAEYRSVSSSSLISILLHEEAHLAAALEMAVAPTFDALGSAVFEASAEIVQHAACLVATGHYPSRDELLDYLAVIDEVRLVNLVTAIAADADVGDLVRQATALAVTGAGGDHALRESLGARRFAAVARALGEQSG